MAANNTATLRAEKRTIPPVAIVIGLALVLGGAGFWYLNRAAQRPPTPLPPLTGDAKAYLKYLPLSEVSMEAHESYLKQRVVEITGKIGNTGNRVIDTATIYCVFYDSYNQVVLRQRVDIVTKKMGGLAPGDVKPFRLPFDTIPDGWNQALPQIVIARIEFA